MTKKTEEKTCPLCGKEMPVEYVCNMETLTGRAGWHMDYKTRIVMCKECSKALLDAVNDWYKKRNKTGYYDKWTDVKKEKEEKADE